MVNMSLAVSQPQRVFTSVKPKVGAIEAEEEEAEEGSTGAEEELHWPAISVDDIMEEVLGKRVKSRLMHI